jgi:hypothetical protein
MLERPLEYFLTLAVGVFAACTWVSKTVRAVASDGELSAKGLFVWLAAVAAGVAVGVVVGMLTAGFRARQAARDMARGGPNAVWNSGRLALVMGILYLGWATGPIFAAPHGLWAWSHPVGVAILAGTLLGLGFLWRDERRLPVPPPAYYPPTPYYPPPPPVYPPPPPGYRPASGEQQPHA